MFLLQLDDSFTVIHRRLDEVTITTTTTINAPIQKDYRCRRRCSNYNLVMPSDKPHGIDGMHDHHLLRIACHLIAYLKYGCTFFTGPLTLILVLPLPPSPLPLVRG